MQTNTLRLCPMHCRKFLFCAAKIALVIEGGIDTVGAHPGRRDAVVSVQLCHSGLLPAAGQRLVDWNFSTFNSKSKCPFCIKFQKWSRVYLLYAANRLERPATRPLPIGALRAAIPLSMPETLRPSARMAHVVKRRSSVRGTCALCITYIVKNFGV